MRAQASFSSLVPMSTVVAVAHGIWGDSAGPKQGEGHLEVKTPLREDRIS